MFTLELLDINGVVLQEGDIVKVINGRGSDYTFFSEVKYLEKENAIAPFHTFCFHSFEKVDKLPEGVVESNEERYKIWYHGGMPQKGIDGISKYLADWRACERAIDKGTFKITRK